MTQQDLKQAGLKITLPRMKVLDILRERSDSHLSAEDVYKALLSSGEEVGLATVYRVLTQFESAGLVKRHNFEGGQAVFELDQGDHHDHIVCIGCGKIAEFFDASIERKQRQIAEKFEFELVDHSLVLYGRCATCQKEARRTR